MKIFDWLLLLLLFIAFFVLVKSTHGAQLIILNRTDLTEKMNIERNDIVEIMPDNYVPEGHVLDKSKFLIIKVPNDTKDIDKFLDTDSKNNYKKIYKVNIDSMTATEKTNFEDNKLTLTKDKAEKLIVKKTTATVDK